MQAVIHREINRVSLFITNTASAAALQAPSCGDLSSAHVGEGSASPDEKVTQLGLGEEALVQVRQFVEILADCLATRVRAKLRCVCGHHRGCAYRTSCNVPHAYTGLAVHATHCDAHCCGIVTRTVACCSGIKADKEYKDCENTVAACDEAKGVARIQTSTTNIIEGALKAAQERMADSTRLSADYKSDVQTLLGSAQEHMRYMVAEGLRNDVATMNLLACSLQTITEEACKVADGLGALPRVAESVAASIRSDINLLAPGTHCRGRVIAYEGQSGAVVQGVPVTATTCVTHTHPRMHVTLPFSNNPNTTPSVCIPVPYTTPQTQCTHSRHSHRHTYISTRAARAHPIPVRLTHPNPPPPTPIQHRVDVSYHTRVKASCVDTGVPTTSTQRATSINRPAMNMPVTPPLVHLEMEATDPRVLSMWDCPKELGADVAPMEGNKLRVVKVASNVGPVLLVPCTDKWMRPTSNFMLPPPPRRPHSGTHY